MIKRAEVWNLLIEADSAVRYYDLISDVCRWFDSLVRVLLLMVNEVR